MSDAIRNLEPTVLFRNFAAFTRIPRGSGNEAGAREHVRSWAREHGFDTRIDAAGNIVVRVPATPGFEKAPAIVLQGHLDMVCEKLPDVKIDFATDPLDTYVDGDWIRARGTTLGADNGIGLSSAMAAAEDPTCVHPALEILATVDEETGMTGAFNLDPHILDGRVMLNLDSEDEGVLFVGCAGGGDSKISLPVVRQSAPAGFACVHVKVSGLRGGHSGLDIAKGRGNALRILARAIEAGGGLDVARVGTIAGGTKRNAIPRDSDACVYMPEAQIPAFVAGVEAFLAVARTELGANDPGLIIETATGSCCNVTPIDAEGSSKLLRLLLALPHGPIAMSQDIPGLVETSTNLAIVAATENEATLLTNSRSSVGTAMEAVRHGIAATAALAGATTALTGQYPGWRPNMESPILKRAAEVWERTTGKAASVTAIHAGLECGVIGERVRGMDMVSCGPNMRNVHSPDEALSIASSARFFAYLKELLADVARNPL